MNRWNVTAQVREENAIGITYPKTFTMESEEEPSQYDIFTHIRGKRYDTWHIISIERILTHNERLDAVDRDWRDTAEANRLARSSGEDQALEVLAAGNLLPVVGDKDVVAAESSGFGRRTGHDAGNHDTLAAVEHGREVRY